MFPIIYKMLNKLLRKPCLQLNTELETDGQESDTKCRNLNQHTGGRRQ